MVMPVDSADAPPAADLATTLLDEEAGANAAGDDAATSGTGILSRLPFPALILVSLPGAAISVTALAVCGFVVATAEDSDVYGRVTLSADYRFGLFTGGAVDDSCVAYREGLALLGSAQRLGRATSVFAALLAFVGTFGTIYVSLLADGTKWLPGSGVLYIASAACQAATLAFLYGLDPCAEIAETKETGADDRVCHVDFGPGAVLAVVSAVLHLTLGSYLL